jgi:hypothetical protein
MRALEADLLYAVARASFFGAEPEAMLALSARGEGTAGLAHAMLGATDVGWSWRAGRMRPRRPTPARAWPCCAPTPTPGLSRAGWRTTTRSPRAWRAVGAAPGRETRALAATIRGGAGRTL